ncbi:MAG: sulfotransferase family protein [Nitrososphaeraceae archaeon]
MTNKKYHFIAGLPRSGTTLLSTILNQNPIFEASISGPLARFVRAIIQESSSQGGYRFECPPNKRKKLIYGLFDNYYDDITKNVAFNTNRGWPLLLPTIKTLYPNSKMILCVREIGWILDSFENLQRQNPFEFTSMFSPEENINVYTRCETLLHPNRTLGFAYNAVKQAITSDYQNTIMIVDYDNLVRHPHKVMRQIYEFINEPYFNHDFDRVEASYTEFDDDVQLPGLHTTRPKVEFISRQTIIPPDIWNRVVGMDVWK